MLAIHEGWSIGVRYPPTFWKSQCHFDIEYQYGLKGIDCKGVTFPY